MSEIEKHDGVFFGRVLKVRYEFDTYRKFINFDDYEVRGKIYKDHEVQMDEIDKCTFDRPPLTIGEQIHLHNLDKIVKVINVIRSTNGNLLYYTDYIVKEVEDDETQQSKIEAERRLKEWEEKQNFEKENEEENDISLKSKKKWYQFWK